jgi:hypothetical protein
MRMRWERGHKVLSQPRIQQPQYFIVVQNQDDPLGDLAQPLACFLDGGRIATGRSPEFTEEPWRRGFEMTAIQVHDEGFAGAGLSREGLQHSRLTNTADTVHKAHRWHGLLKCLGQKGELFVSANNRLLRVICEEVPDSSRMWHTTPSCFFISGPGLPSNPGDSADSLSSAVSNWN